MHFGGTVVVLSNLMVGAGSLDIQRQLLVGAAMLNGSLPLGVAKPATEITPGSVPVQAVTVLPPAKAMPHWPPPLQGNTLAQASSSSFQKDNDELALAAQGR